MINRFKQLGLGTKVLLISLIILIPLCGLGFALQRQFEQEISRDHNALVCITRKYILAARDRAYVVINNPKSGEVAVKNAVDAVNADNEFLDGLITVPKNHVCKYKKEKK